MFKPTARQIEIRDAEELSLLVIAPAGCGKTEALALRIQGIIRRGVTRIPRRILVVTFTNRARDNIFERLQQYLHTDEIQNYVTVQNLHGIAARIIRSHGNVIGIDEHWIFPESDWISNECRDRKLNYSQSTIVKQHLQMAKLQTINDAEVARYLAMTNHPIAIEIERKRVAEEILTYDDLPRLADLILGNETVAGLYAEHFSCVIVDEFQDLTRQQLSIVQRLGVGRVTYAGDLAQGIYGFTGADPRFVLEAAKKEVAREITFAESHRSSPAVLDLVNAISATSGGIVLECSSPDSWPGLGLASHQDFEDQDSEAAWVISFSKAVLSRAPMHRVAVLCRSKARRNTLDKLINPISNIAWYRWDDPIFDTQTAPLLRAALRRVKTELITLEISPVDYLISLVPQHELQDPSTRENFVEGCLWISDLVREGISTSEIQSRIKMGENGETLLTAPGLHLLTGHAGKGQQFDWVIVLGLESDSIPSFQAKTEAAQLEELRVLSVMISRARHGVITTRSKSAIKPWGDRVATGISPFFYTLERSESYMDWPRAKEWLDSADWAAIRAR
jgi:DNA helicase II / ATP-dependent DNA helicase PcrA